LINFAYATSNKVKPVLKEQRHINKMSAKRPGTVDYSKWDSLEDNSDDEEEEKKKIRRTFGDGESDEDVEDYSSEDDDDEDEEDLEDCSSEDDDDNDDDSSSEERSKAASSSSPENNDDEVRYTGPSLAALQLAWNTDITNIDKPCSTCFTPNAQYRCSRCQLVRYCSVTCQRGYHPIHQLECIDAGLHQKYWGMFDRKKSRDEVDVAVVDDFVVLRARRSSRRRGVINCLNSSLYFLSTLSAI